jgi:hypothetical protein
MSITKVKTLYDSDFALWIDETVKHLKSGQLENLDIENLIEEIESLGRSDKRELRSRLITLFEHGLKRRYVGLPDCYRGWEVTLNRTQQKLNIILQDSPSLKNFLTDILPDCYQDALKNMRQEYDINFPESLPFSPEIDILLNSDFWQK